MKPALRRWRRLRRWLLTALACVLVSAAGLMAVGRLMVPWLVDSPQAVAAWLSLRIDRNVEIDAVSAHWDGPGPILDLSGLTISGSAGDPAAITLGRARVQVDVYALFMPGRHLIRDFLLVDARVELVREVDGRIILDGFGQRTPDFQALRSWLGRVGHLGLSGGQLSLYDRASDRRLVLDDVELRLTQDGEQLRLGLERDSRDGKGRLRVALVHQGPLQWPPLNGELFLSASEFPVADLGGLSEPFALGLLDGVVQGQQWLSWKDHGLESLQGDWSVERLVLAAPAFDLPEAGVIVPNLHLPAGRVVLTGTRLGPDFVVDLRAGDSLEADQLVTELSARRSVGGSWDIAAQAMPVALLAAVTQLLDAAPGALRSRVYSAQPRGTLGELRAHLNREDWRFSADVTDFAARPAGNHWPTVSGLSARISGDPQAILVQVDDAPVEFAVPGVFRESIALSKLKLLIGVHRDSDTGNWRVEAPEIHADGQGYSADLALRLDLDPAAGPRLQLQAHVPGAEIEAAKAFWVINKMPPRTIAWLDHALGVGRVTTGTVLYQGALRDWPFATNQGRFEARFAVAGAQLDYHPDWPRAEDVAVEAAFINSSLVVDRTTGMLSGNRVVRGSGAIPSLKDPVLSLDLAGEGDASGWLQFLKATPVQRAHGAVLFGMSLRGRTDVGAQITIPLRKNLGRASVAGQALLKGVSFSDTKWDLQFDEVHGRADFSEGGFAADRLSLHSQGQAAELSIAVGTFSSDPGLQAEASLSGKLSAQSLFGQHEALTNILSKTSGSADWNVNLSVQRSATSAKSATSISYSSRLQGIAIAFPSPLGKPADTELPLLLQVELPATDTAPTLRLDLGTKARLFGVIGTREADFRGQLQLGAELPQDLPSAGLRVSGNSAALDIAGWAGWMFSSTSSAADSILTDIDLRLGDQERLRLDRSDGPWVLKLDGPNAQGSVRFEAAGDRPAAVIAQFERLHLPEPGDGAADFLVTPTMVPTLHLWVRDLRVGAARLGEARLEAFATDQGLRVELLEARSPDLEIHASGDWLSTANGPESRFKIRMVSEDLGRMLTGLGFAGVIAGGQTLAEFDAHWRGAPYAFALERLTGSIKVSVGQGRFLDVDPGAGRIFGLLSLRELPRRLTLDFRDLFQAGMSFDRIEGRFQLADGNAWTENLTVRGPAADILIIGRTGLASRDYDQQVMVAPHVSGVLPVLGGLAAGPVGAAAGFLAQGMVQKGSDIEKTSRVHYSIAGSWEKPVVARLTPMRPDAPPRRRIDPTPVDAG